MSLVKKFSKDKTKCEVTFTLAREAVNGGNEVLLVGEFNNWNPAEGVALVAKKNEYKTVLKLEAGKKYEYRYLVDGNWWTNDATPDAFVSNPFGTVNSVVAIEKPTAKVATKKVAAKKATPAKKTTAKKVAVKKATPAKKTATKKVTAKKATPAKKTTAKKVAAKKATPAKKTAAKKVTAKKATPVKKTTAKKVAAKKVTKATATKDKLTKIEGIGPKIAGLLNAAGIVTFADLGKAKVTTLRTILADAGSRFKMHNPSTWAKQAKLAAKGNWDALKTLQDKLNGGV